MARRTTGVARDPGGRPTRGRLRPLGLDEVRITGGFWGPASRSTPTAIARPLPRLDGTRRLDRQLRPGRPRAGCPTGPARTGVRRLRGLQAARSHGLGGRPRGRRRPGPAISASLAAESRAAQEPDGYLNTAFGRPGQPRPLQRPRVGPRAVLLRPPDPGRRGAARTRRRAATLAKIARRAADHVCADLRPRRHRARLRARRDRDGPGRAGPGDRRAALPRPGRAVRRPPRPRHARRHRVRPRLLPGRRARSARPRCCAATPSAPSTSRPAPSTSPWRPGTTNCSRRSYGSGRPRSPDAPT